MVDPTCDVMQDSAPGGEYRQDRCGSAAEWYYPPGDFWLCRECFWEYRPGFRIECQHASTNPGQPSKGAR